MVGCDRDQPPGVGAAKGGKAGGHVFGEVDSIGAQAGGKAGGGGDKRPVAVGAAEAHEVRGVREAVGMIVIADDDEAPGGKAGDGGGGVAAGGVGQVDVGGELRCPLSVLRSPNKRVERTTENGQRRTEMTVAHRLQEIREELARAAKDSLLAGKVPELVAVSKFQPVEKVREALEAGQRLFGENQLQDAKERWEPLRKEYTDVRLHFIGTLQSRKVAEVVELFDVIESLDREKLADRFAACYAAGAPRRELYIQINTGEEPQKGGVAPKAFRGFLEYCVKDKGLPVTGVMGIPPADDDPALHFALLHKMAKEAGLPNLSMGMSGDYLIAVQFGATHVRVGTALFGERGVKG